jgi:tryptophanyl-tRNA synthetase
MSKSKNNYIGFLDTNEELTKKIKKIPTSAIAIEESKNPDECNVYLITKPLLTDEEDALLRKRYTDGGL